MVRWISLLVLFVIPGLAFGKIRVNGLFSDHMVFQRAEPVFISGTTAPGKHVSLFFRTSIISCKTDKQGRWEATFPAGKAGGPFTLTIEDGSDSIRFQDVMVGEVWFASGQSNMEHPMEGWEWLPHSSVYRSEEEIADSDYPEIRLFSVPKNPSSQEVTQVPEGKWEVANPAHIRSFSSTAWFFAKELYNRLKVPVGIINAPWAGTSIHAWESRDVLLKFKDTLDYKGTPLIPARPEVMDALLANRERRCLITTPRENQVETISRLPCSAWTSVDLIRGDKYPEVVWLKKEIDIPERWSKEPLYFSLGYLNRQSIVYFNGVEVGDYLYPAPAVGSIRRHLICPGRNTLIVRLAQPFGLSGMEGEKENYSLSSRDHRYREDLSGGWSVICQDSIPKVRPEYQNLPGALFNGMVNPCLKYNIKGVIWYQGENDVYRPELYAELFKSLITDWRQKWKKPSMPFLYAQISILPDIRQEENAAMYRKFRDYQDVGLPHTAMVYSLDIGDPYDPHPRNKKVVGLRLAEEALKKVYGLLIP